MPIGSTLALIASIATLAGTGVSVGEMIANRPGKPKPPTAAGPTAATPAQQKLTQAQEAGAIGQQLPNILSQTSGLTNPEYAGSIANMLAGTAGQQGSSSAVQQAIAQAFGLGGGGFGGGAPGTPQKFTPAGSASSPNTIPGNPTALSDFVSSYI